jgi:hypothetical protein
MEHKITYEIKGEGFNEHHTPICSCGWRGIGYANYNSWKSTNIKAQEDKHLKEVKNEKR